MKTSNAFLDYEIDNQRYYLPLYVEILDQPQALTGQTYQSRLARQFYPRSHMPGDIAITGRCTSQKELQQLGLFIRTHQRAMVSVPNDMLFSRLDTGSAGYRRLMRLYVNKEGISVRGFIPRFTVSKKGVFEPAPQYTLPFTVIFDPHASNISISHALTKYNTSPDTGVISKPTVVEDPNIQDVINNIGGNANVPGMIRNPALPGK